MKKNRIGAMDIALLAASAVFLIGLLTIFQPCGPKEDGGWMTCHWAGQALRGIAAAMVVLAALRLFVSQGAQRGLDLSLAVLSVLSACVPGRLIGMCMMHTMRCHRLMTPFALVMAALTILLAGIDLLQGWKKGKDHEV